MDTTCDVCQFLDNKPLQNQIITTSHWTVGIIPNQAYLGRALITLLTHKGRLGQLSQEEWQDFQNIVQRLGPAYEKAFGANPLNIGCYMNNGYKDDPPHPHVHWHIFPRYRKAPVLNGIAYDDPLFGHFYNDNAERLVSIEVVEQIASKLG